MAAHFRKKRTCRAFKRRSISAISEFALKFVSAVLSSSLDAAVTVSSMLVSNSLIDVSMLPMRDSFSVGKGAGICFGAELDGARGMSLVALPSNPAVVLPRCFLVFFFFVAFALAILVRRRLPPFSELRESIDEDLESADE